VTKKVQTPPKGLHMERSPTLEKLVHSWFDAASRGDPSLVRRHVRLDTATRLVGSDPNEWIQGGDAVAEFLAGEVEGAAGAATFTPSDTEAFTEGTVGWAATKLTITLPDGTAVSPRWTAVFVRHDGEWQFVQTHASIATGNDEAGWTYE
jgi:ketosteroid isomerase-like protein